MLPTGKEHGKMMTTLLVVDDNAPMLSAVNRMLSRHGYNVLPANGARQALEIVNGNASIQLILSDIMLPEMRGTQLVREVLRLSPQTAGLLMTAGAIPTDLPDGVAVLRKPFSIQELVFKVQAVLAQSDPREAEVRQKTIDILGQSPHVEWIRAGS